MADARRLVRATATGSLSAAATTWAVAAALAVVYILSTLPTPLYAVYGKAFGFSSVTLTLVFAAYVIGTLTAMLFAGRLSDQIGRRPVTLAAIGIGIVSAILFLLARSTPWLFAARIVTGCAVALASGASTAWIIESHTASRRQATQIAIAANLFGLALGPLLGGVLAQHAPSPLRLPYVATLPLLLAAFAGVWLGRETLERPKALKDASLRPRFAIPASIRAQFLVPAVGAFATFSVLGFYSALVPGVLQHALHDSNLTVAGAVTGGMFLVSTAAVALTDMPAVRGVIAGLILVVLGVGTLILAERAHSMVLLLVATGLIGIACGLGYRFGLELVNEMSPADRRSEVVSGYLVVCYAAISLPVIGVGLLTAATGSLIADEIFGAVVALLALAALAIEIVLRSRGGRRVTTP